MPLRSKHARTALCFFVITVLMSVDLSARQTATSKADWGRVQSLKPGDYVIVGRIAAKDVHGTVIAVTTESLTVERKNAPLIIPKSEIRRVKVESQAQRRKDAIIATSIGAAGGIAAAIIADGALTDGNGVSESAAALFGTIGALTGFVSRTVRRSYRTLYETK